MGRFSDRATRPQRGLTDILRWKLLGLRDGGGRSSAGDFRPPSRENDGRCLDEVEAHATWVGHATYVLRLGGKLVATDPIWARFVGPRRRLAKPGLPLSAVARRLDVVTISHNHRDHLDARTIGRLGSSPLYVAPLGNAPALRAAGANRIVELDWWESHREDDLQITLVPARHWSMRTPWDRNEALWGGFVLRGPEGAAYHSGDTAMFDAFGDIGQRLGPIDWAMLPIGAYDPRWFMSPQHLCPEEAGEAFEMLGARRLLAMHWGTYQLTDEPMHEPPERLRAWARERGLGDDRIWIFDVGETRRLV